MIHAVHADDKRTRGHELVGGRELECSRDAAAMKLQMAEQDALA